MKRSGLFDADRHARFARLSGDFNPMHMDAVAARRTQAGAPVVHGMHTLLWLIDAVVAAEPALPVATALKARLLKMVYVGERVDAEIVQRTDAALRARALVGGIEVLSLWLDFSVPRRQLAPPAPVGEALPPPSVPVELSLEALTGRAGRLCFAGAAEDYASLFPQAVAYLGAQRVAALGCSSCLVGMVVPGLHSVYGGVDLMRADADERSGELAFAVTMVDPRFRLVRTAIHGGGWLGSIDSASRQPPVIQPPIAQLAARVRPDECRGSIALIVGGSRGIGELTAKLIAAAGGRVIVTYHSGATDAERVAREIRDFGGACEIARYDARAPSAAQLAGLSAPPSQLYYFATPMIAARKAGLCDAARLDEFNAFYLTGFLELVQACRALRPQGIAVFYPSSVYVTSRPAEMTEYAMSKAAGEILCEDIARFMPQVRVLHRRLPRLPTDQSASLLPVDKADPVDVMLPIIRELQAIDLESGN